MPFRIWSNAIREIVVRGAVVAGVVAVVGGGGVVGGLVVVVVACNVPAKNVGTGRWTRLAVSVRVVPPHMQRRQAWRTLPRAQSEQAFARPAQ